MSVQYTARAEDAEKKVKELRSDVSIVLFCFCLIKFMLIWLFAWFILAHALQ